MSPRCCRLRWRDRTVELPLALVGAVGPAPPVTPVARAPAGVAGVAEAGGELLTLLDTRPWLGESGDGRAPGLLLRLAGRFRHLGLLLPAGCAVATTDEASASAVAARGVTRLDEAALDRHLRALAAAAAAAWSADALP